MTSTPFYSISCADGSKQWLKTDLGTQNADLEVDVGVRAVLDIVLNAGKESNGRFRNIKVDAADTDPNRPVSLDTIWFWMDELKCLLTALM